MMEAAVHMNGWASKVLLILLTLLVSWTAYEAIEGRTFREAGGRFTREDGIKLGHRVSLLEQNFGFVSTRLTEAVSALGIETQRLQLQIDRLEGHAPETYTSDGRQ